MTNIDQNDADRLGDELLAVAGDENAFRKLVAREPAVLDPAVEEHFLRLAAIPVYGKHFTRLAALVRRARDDVDAAWLAQAKHLDEIERVTKQAAALDEHIDTALDEGRGIEALELAVEAQEMATEAGLGGVVADFHLRAAQILIRGGVASRDEEVETAIAELETGVGLASSPEQHAVFLMNLGLAGPERVRGDRRENSEQAIELFRDAIDTLGATEPSELDACLRTNFASVMLGLETDDPVANLRAARALVDTALEFRSVNIDATNWAYSQVNLGLILDRLEREGVEVDGAEEAWQAVIDQADRCPPMLVGAAHHGLGQRMAAQAQPPEPALEDEEESGEEPPEPSLTDDDEEEVDVELLREACAHLQLARTLLVDAHDQHARGRVLDDLAGVLAQLDETDASIAVGAEALELLGPTTSPRDAVTIANRLGSQLADQERWDEAAEVFRQGVLGAEVAIDTRNDPADRRNEAERAGAIARWASYCLAKAGHLVEAALALENGRTREARRRLGVGTGTHDLDELEPSLREAYESALDRLRNDTLDGSGSNASRALQEALHQIREQPGWESFASGTGEQGLIAALEEGWPLVYVSPAPWGTVLLMLEATEEGAEVAAKFIEATSLAVFMRLMAGDAAETLDFDNESDARSYFFGISTDEPDHDLQEDIEHALPWLGESLGRPIAQMLDDRDLDAATLIVCGPLGAAPLHAAPWGEHSRCLLDEADIRFAPSAVVLAAALQRAAVADGESPRLLALGDTKQDLPAASAEVQEIARSFPADRRVIFQGDDATAEAFLEQAPGATHLHLACHARGGLFDTDRSTVEFADRDIEALELTSLVGLNTRLVTISACRSAMAGLTQFADEVFSFGTAVLAAGSACSIATLWPVDDAATALLMTKMYEVLAEGATPPQALRRAQLWLRDLDADAEAQYLAQHPALEAEFRRRTDAGRPPGRAHSPTGCRFSHPDYWASFIASGA